MIKSPVVYVSIIVINPNFFSKGLIASKFQPDELFLLYFLGEEESYQPAVPGLIGMPVTVIPTTLAIFLNAIFFFGLEGKQYLRFWRRNLLGLPLAGNSPIE